MTGILEILAFIGVLGAGILILGVFVFDPIIKEIYKEDAEEDKE